MRIAAPGSTPVGFSRAKSRATYRWTSQPNLNWSSISEPLPVAIGYGRGDRSTKLIRGLTSEAPAGFRSRRGPSHDSTLVTPHNAPFSTYKAPRFHHAVGVRGGSLAACSARTTERATDRRVGGGLHANRSRGSSSHRRASRHATEVRLGRRPHRAYRVSLGGRRCRPWKELCNRVGPINARRDGGKWQSVTDRTSPPYKHYPHRIHPSLGPGRQRYCRRPCASQREYHRVHAF